MTTEKNVPALDSSEKERETSGLMLLGRLIWALFGPVILVSLWIPMAGQPIWLGTWEMAYFLNTALMVWGRYVEQKSGQGTTVHNEPSTWEHYRAYVGKLVLLTIGAWLIIKAYFL